MAKSQKLEAVQAEVNQILHQLDPATTVAIATPKNALGSKQPVAIAQVAKLVAKHHLTDLISILINQFERLLVKGTTTDPNCLAKKAIANALYHLEYPEADLFLAGIHHIQPEPVWGGQADTAPGLRAICALALVHANYPDIMVKLTDLLADPEPEARIGAARAIAYCQNPGGIFLLRLKVQLGDDALYIYRDSKDIWQTVQMAWHQRQDTLPIEMPE